MFRSFWVLNVPFWVHSLLGPPVCWPRIDVRGMDALALLSDEDDDDVEDEEDLEDMEGNSEAWAV